MIKEDKYKRITGIHVTLRFDDGDYVTEGIGIDSEFVADLYSNIRVFGNHSHEIGAMTYLLNLGSKAITGINPKDYVSGIKTHFGNTRNINEWRQVFPKTSKEIMNEEKAKEFTDMVIKMED